MWITINEKTRDSTSYLALFSLQGCYHQSSEVHLCKETSSVKKLMVNYLPFKLFQKEMQRLVTPKTTYVPSSLRLITAQLQFSRDLNCARLYALTVVTMEMTFGREVGQPSRMIDLSLRHRSFRSLHQRVSSNFSPAFSHSLALTASIKSSKPFPSKASRPAKKTSDVKDLGPAFLPSQTSQSKYREAMSANIHQATIATPTWFASTLHRSK